MQYWKQAETKPVVEPVESTQRLTACSQGRAARVVLHCVARMQEISDQHWLLNTHRTRFIHRGYLMVAS